MPDPNKTKPPPKRGVQAIEGGTRYIEPLHHLICAACRGPWTVSDPPRQKKLFCCPHCGRWGRFA